jgi:hypothetical protein
VTRKRKEKNWKLKFRNVRKSRITIRRSVTNLKPAEKSRYL